MEHPAEPTGITARSTIMYLAPVLPQDGPVSPDLDRQLGVIARTAGAGNRIARDSLYWAVAGRLEPSVRRAFRVHLETRRRTFLELDDLQQTGYLVFVDLVGAWDGDGPFMPYLFGLFRWRLRHALRQHHREPDAALPQNAIAHDTDSAPAAELLERLLARLPERQRSIVDLRVAQGLTFVDIGELLGVSARTIHRDLRAIAHAVRMGILE